MSATSSHWHVVALAAMAAAALVGCGTREPPSSGGPSPVRRLTQDQYRHSIADIFGPDIKLGGRFEPDVRTDGLLAVGTSRVAVTPAGMEQYDNMARTIASEVFDVAHRNTLLPCAPASARSPDDACASWFIREVGLRLFRRPLTGKEMKTWVGAAKTVAITFNDFYEGLEVTLEGMLDSSNFLFIDQRPDPASGEPKRVDVFSKASRLSFFLWNTTPDDELLAAAQRGELDTHRGLTHQVDRLMSSPRIADGVRAFFADFLHFDDFDHLSKDAVIYPNYSAALVDEAKEQTLRTITDLLLTQRGDYRDLFTTRKTLMTRSLGIIYRIPVDDTTGWSPYEFPPGSPRAGLLTQVAFLVLDTTHPGRSSPTIRGKAVRESLLCQTIPTPPNNVNFKLVEDTSNPRFKTVRERLTAHRSEPTCAGCHKVMDPIGLGLENFDGIGRLRMQENGAPIDASGELDGLSFKDAAGLGKALHDDPELSACLVHRIYEYGVGRPAVQGERNWLKFMGERFAADGYRIPDLLRRIALSDAFYRMAEPPSRITVAEARK